MSAITHEFIVCSCMSDEHVVHFMYCEWGEGDNDLYMSVFLRGWPWWKRLWIALRYVLGHRSKYGEFDGGFSLSEKEKNKLVAFLSKTKLRG